MEQKTHGSDARTTPVVRPRSPEEVAAAIERARVLVERYIPAGSTECLADALIRDRRAENKAE
jgi:FAD/FMN-containing dehydrogenase